MRTVSALILAPLPAMVLSSFVLHYNRHQYGLLAAAVGLLTLAYALNLVVILPGHLLLLRAKHSSLINYLLLGFLGFALPVLVYMIYKSPGMFRYEILPASYWGALGAISTALFWYLRKPSFEPLRPVSRAPS